MLEIIKEVIVKWDPIGLMEFAPSDEYDDECQMIFDRFAQKQELLGKIIYDIFINSFGEAFQDDLATCQKVAIEIENRISTN